MHAPANANPVPSNPPFPFYYGAEEGGFAFPTVNTRWPVILTGVIDEIHRRMASKSSPSLSALLNLPEMAIGSEEEAKDIISRVAALKYEVWRAKPVRKLESDGGNDNDIWNKSVRDHFSGFTFYSASWLWAECYLYRRIQEALSLSKTWSKYDPFLMQKLSAFVGSFDGVRDLTVRLVDSLNTESSLFLRELLLLALWGNATDLSMFAGKNEDEIKDMKAGGGEQNILANDLDLLVPYVASLRAKRVDFILDNSGFELFSDLLLADNLVQSGRASEIVFHMKAMPWFVSDTNAHDVEWLLRALEVPEEFFKSALKGQSLDSHAAASLKKLGARWRSYIEKKSWVFTTHLFWTTGWAYHHLPTEAQDLWDQLKSSSLLIFKGDLNYRKLVYDCKWPADTPFSTAIGALASGPPLVSLRTNKSDPIVGLASGKAEKMNGLDKEWRWSGKYAILSYFPGATVA
ncbi:hypothetical protein HDU96_009204 [Phlyctochytrium bullatum]|nr:hypothetical protein HDU96_009204 [Phlyctochytrium bullatum]